MAAAPPFGRSHVRRAAQRAQRALPAARLRDPACRDHVPRNRYGPLAILRRCRRIRHASAAPWRGGWRVWPQGRRQKRASLVAEPDETAENGMRLPFTILPTRTLYPCGAAVRVEAVFPIAGAGDQGADPTGATAQAAGRAGYTHSRRRHRPDPSSTSAASTGPSRSLQPAAHIRNLENRALDSRQTTVSRRAAAASFAVSRLSRPR